MIERIDDSAEAVLQALERMEDANNPYSTYDSMQEYAQDVRNPRYKTDPVYQKRVDARFNRSASLWGSTQSSDKRTEITINKVTGEKANANERLSGKISVPFDPEMGVNAGLSSIIEVEKD